MTVAGHPFGQPTHGASQQHAGSSVIGNVIGPSGTASPYTQQFTWQTVRAVRPIVTVPLVQSVIVTVPVPSGS